MNERFLYALPVLEQLHKHGFEAYFVGGSVRDQLLNRAIGDIDIATSAKPNEVIELFPKTVDVGSEHGTVIVIYNNCQYEVTTFRSEAPYIDYRRPSSVSFIISIEKDLQRRDFTMNAIAMSANGKLIDPYDGRKAIRLKLIQSVGNPVERFTEDALRMMRALRFVSQLSFYLENETKIAICENAHLISNVSIERITIEFEKMLHGNSVSHAIQLLLETGLYEFLPGLRPYGLQIDKLKTKKLFLLQEREEIWSLLVYFIELNNIDYFLKQWKHSNKLIKAVKTIVDGLRVRIDNGWSKFLLYQLGLHNSISVERIYCALFDEHLERNAKFITQSYETLPIKTRNDLSVTGEDLLNWFTKKPGPWLAQSINMIERAIIHEKVRNDKKSIKEWLLSCNQKNEKNY